MPYPSPSAWRPMQIELGRSARAPSIDSCKNRKRCGARAKPFETIVLLHRGCFNADNPSMIESLYVTTDTLRRAFFATGPSGYLVVTA